MAGQTASTVSAAKAGGIGRRASVVVYFCCAVIAIVAFVSVFADLIAPYSPVSQDLANAFAPMGAEHLLGTDDLGRDILSRMIYGARISVLSATLAVIVSLVIGLPIGVAAGYLGGAVDAVFMRIVDSLLSFPAIVLAISITAMLGPGVINAMIAVGVAFSPYIARLIRAQILTVRTMTYVEAARSFGARGFFRLVLPHILPNAIQPVIVQSTILLGTGLIAEAGLSFIGLGVQAPNPSWGAVLSRAYAFIAIDPVAVFVPGSAIALTVFAINVLGDELQRLLDPRRKR